MNARDLIRAGAALLGCLLLTAASPAGEGAKGLEEMREAFAGVKTIRTDFTQEKHMRILDRPLLSEGRFFFRSPADLRWEYAAPVRSVLLMQGGDAERYTWRDGGWVRERGSGLDAMGVVLRDISGWLAGDFTSSTYFTGAREPGPPVRVILTPRDPSMGAFIREVILTLSPRPGVLESVEIVEGPGNTTRIRFRDTEVNVAFPSGFFEEEGLPPPPPPPP